MGLQVCAVDIDDGELALAKKMGADFVVNALHGEPEEVVKKRTGGGAHGVHHGAVVRCNQAGCRHDAQARHLRSGRTAAR